MNKKGDILIGNKTTHPIIYLREKDGSYFIGCIITHSTENKYKNNVAFLPKHFETHDIKKNKFNVVYDDSYFVSLELIKKMEWGPFNKVGKMTSAGIEYLEKYLAQGDSKEWRDYIKKNK